jgi:hypothetical protein
MVIWTRNSPAWTSGEATLHRATMALDNPGYVDAVLHSCRRSRPSLRAAWQTATSRD